MNILVLEASTSAAKAMVYTKDAGVLRLEIVPYTKEVSTGDTQDAEGVFRLLADAGRRVASSCVIDAVAIVATWHSLLLCQNGRPSTPVYMWPHTGASEAAKPYAADRELSFDISRKTGCPPHASYPLYKLLYLKEQGLDIGSYDISGSGEYIFSQLTGERGTSLNMASGTGLLNIHSLTWDHGMLDIAGVSQAQLPELYRHDHHFPLTAAAAGQLGLPAGIPVTLPYADGAMTQLGAGAFRPHRMTLSVGTSCAARIIAETPPENASAKGLWCYYGAGNWITGAATSGGTNCLDWFQNTLGGGRTLKDLDGSVHAGDLPAFLPFLYGERCPGWDADRRSGYIGILPAHTVESLYAAMLEGILFNLYQCYENLAAISDIQSIQISGGILYSPVWTQMAADILGRELQVPETEQTSMLGGACMGLHALKQIKDLSLFGQTACRMIRPRPEMYDYYRKHYLAYLDAYFRNMKKTP